MCKRNRAEKMERSTDIVIIDISGDSSDEEIDVVGGMEGMSTNNDVIDLSSDEEIVTITLDESNGEEIDVGVEELQVSEDPICIDYEESTSGSDSEADVDVTSGLPDEPKEFRDLQNDGETSSTGQPLNEELITNEVERTGATVTGEKSVEATGEVDTQAADDSARLEVGSSVVTVAEESVGVPEDVDIQAPGDFTPEQQPEVTAAVGMSVTAQVMDTSKEPNDEISNVAVSVGIGGGMGDQSSEETIGNDNLGTGGAMLTTEDPNKSPVSGSTLPPPQVPPVSPAVDSGTSFETPPIPSTSRAANEERSEAARPEEGMQQIDEASHDAAQAQLAGSEKLELNFLQIANILAEEINILLPTTSFVQGNGLDGPSTAPKKRKMELSSNDKQKTALTGDSQTTLKGQETEASLETSPAVVAGAALSTDSERRHASSSGSDTSDTEPSDKSAEDEKEVAAWGSAAGFCGKNHWSVEKVLNHRFVPDDTGSGHYEYLIKWENWEKKYNSWEPARNLNCNNLIDAYLESRLEKVVELNKPEPQD